MTQQRKPSICWTLFRLWRAWRRQPELRLGQLIDNALYWGETVPYPDLFNIRDENLIKLIEDFAAVEERV